MKHEQYNFTFEVYNDASELNDDDAALLRLAKEATEIAYAPYSNFRVGAAARLKSGAFVKGSNQENASYPVCICAERVLLSSAASQYPEEMIEAIAVSYHNKNGDSNKPISPCGMCRQSLVEQEERQRKPLRLILGGLEGKVYVIEKASALLPLSFHCDDLKQEFKEKGKLFEM